MKVAIYGAGAMGTVLGTFLTRHRENVDLITRNKKHVEEMKRNGAKVIGSVEMIEKVNVFLPEEMEGKYDIIFLMTKQLDNKVIVRDLVEFLDVDGVICSMQNGIPEIDIAEVIGERRTYGCTMNWAASTAHPGVVKLTSENSPKTLSFGLGSFHRHEGAHFQEVKRLLSIMGEVTVEENFVGVRWSKLLINSGFNGLSAILGATLGEIAKNKTSRRIFQMLVKECIDVAEESEIKIATIQGVNVVKLINYNNPLKRWFSFKIIPILLKKHQHSVSSTYQDIKKGVPTEIEAINGIVVRYGDETGISTPFNNRIIKLVKKLEARELEQSKENLTLFLDLLE